MNKSRKKYCDVLSTTISTTASSSSHQKNLTFTKFNITDNPYSSSQAVNHTSKTNLNKQQTVYDKNKMKTDLNVPRRRNTVSLVEMGFNKNQSNDWEKIPQPSKRNLYVLLKKMAYNIIKPNVQIRIGTMMFNCHMVVLQCYSNFFLQMKNKLLVELPETEITPKTFATIYKWMLAEAPRIEYRDILKVLKGANFLQITELIHQCWVCLDSDFFYENTAFSLYMKARKYGGLKDVEQIMLKRICKFFLTLVSSEDFLRMTFAEIITILSSNCIAVNSEMEVLFSAAYWLNYDWQERQKYVLDVLKLVRFGLIPPYYLATLNSNTGCAEIDRILSLPGVNKMIWDGMPYSTMQYLYSENYGVHFSLIKRLKLVAPVQRQWICKKEQSCLYKTDYNTYPAFLQYLDHIQKIGNSHWRSLKIHKNLEESIRCCAYRNDRKSANLHSGCERTIVSQLLNLFNFVLLD